jgi:hypothetical protein
LEDEMKGMRAPNMLYRKGTQDRIHGVHVDTIVVDEHEVEDYLAQGWHRSPDDVKKFEAGRSREDTQEQAIERAREEGRRQAREAEQQRAFDAAIQRAREEGAREERERIAAEAANAAGKDRNSGKRPQ